MFKGGRAAWGSLFALAVLSGGAAGLSLATSPIDANYANGDQPARTVLARAAEATLDSHDFTAVISRGPGARRTEICRVVNSRSNSPLLVGLLSLLLNPSNLQQVSDVYISRRHLVPKGVGRVSGVTEVDSADVVGGKVVEESVTAIYPGATIEFVAKFSDFNSNTPPRLASSRTDCPLTGWVGYAPLDNQSSP